MQPVQHDHKIQSIQYLRGLAALGVVFCHYGSNLTLYPRLSAFFNFGQSAVYVFFLISGFIIAYALIKSGYTTKQFFTFLFKRSVRIDPAYYLVILLTLLLFQLLSHIPGYRGTGIPFIPAQLFANMFYFAPFTKYPFYNSVFWTLSVEFQFYVVIGLLYFLFESKWYRKGFLLMFSLTSLVHWPNAYFLVFHYASIFAAGISLVMLYQERIWSNLVLPVLFLGMAALQFGPPVFILLVSASVAILYYDRPSRVLNFLGMISYSLYLTHGLVLIVFLGILKRWSIRPDNRPLWWLFAEVSVAVMVACLFYVIIERPSLKLSKRLVYKK